MMLSRMLWSEVPQSSDEFSIVGFADPGPCPVRAAWTHHRAKGQVNIDLLAFLKCESGPVLPPLPAANLPLRPLHKEDRS